MKLMRLFTILFTATILPMMLFTSPSVVKVDFKRAVADEKEPTLSLLQTETPTVEPIIADNSTPIHEMIDKWAGVFGVDPKVAHAVIACESKYNVGVIGDLNLEFQSHGLWQFQERTFNGFVKKYGLKNAELMNPEHQTIIAMQMLRDGLGSRWTCYRRLILRENI